MSFFDSPSGRPQGRAAALHQGRAQQPTRKPTGQAAALHQGRPAPAVPLTGRAAALHSGGGATGSTTQTTMTRQEVLCIYADAIRQTIAYRGQAGVRNSGNLLLQIRKSDVRTWLSVTGRHSTPNLWEEFKAGNGPQNSIFGEEHPICKDLEALNDMKLQTDRAIYLLYKKYKGSPQAGAAYTDLAISFGAAKALEMASTAGNDNYTFIGSANLSAFYLNDRILILLTDSKSEYSLWGHMSHDSDHYRSNGRPYGNTYQFYFWSVPHKSPEWFKNEQVSRNKRGYDEWWHHDLSKASN